jgi:hypothetical protein
VSRRPSAAGRLNTGRPGARAWWFGLMVIAGFGFGLLADLRPFGDGILVHPLVLFFVVAGAALLVLRAVLARPVTDVIPDRALMLGCVLGLAMFLAGNFVAARLLLLS